MCSRYNRLLFSTCVQIAMFGAFVNVPAYAEFKWTPPDDSEQVEDIGADVFVINNENLVAEDKPENELPKYYDSLSEHNVSPNESSSYMENSSSALDQQKDVVNPAETENVSAPDINDEIAPDEDTSVSLVLNPYPLKDGVAVDEEIQSATNVVQNDAISYELLEGFGMDMPLALALRQIVPAEYAYSFDDGINLGAPISWEGGKPWNEVLGDSLVPLGINIVIHDKRVVLKICEEPAAVQAAQKKKEASESIKESDKSEQKSEDVNVSSVVLTPEESMSLSLKETKESGSLPKEEAAEPGENVSEEHIVNVVDGKYPAQKNEKSVSTEGLLSAPESPSTTDENEDAVSALIEDLMEPLDNFEEKKADQDEPFSDDKKVDSDTETSEPVLKPEIVLDEQEKAEEEYAKRLEEASPFEETLDSSGEPVDLSPENSEEMTEATLKKDDAVSEENINTLDTRDPEEESSSDLKAVKNNSGSSSEFRKKPSGKIRIWQAKSGARLQDVIEEWSSLERITLNWDITEKYTLDYDVFISGTYKNAVGILFKKGLKHSPKYVLSEDPYKISVQEDN